MPAGGEELPPLVEGGDSRGEHYVEFFQQAEPARPAGCVVSRQSLNIVSTAGALVVVVV